MPKIIKKVKKFVKKHGKKMIAASAVAAAVGSAAHKGYKIAKTASHIGKAIDKMQPGFKHV